MSTRNKDGIADGDGGEPVVIGAVRVGPPDEGSQQALDENTVVVGGDSLAQQVQQGAGLYQAEARLVENEPDTDMLLARIRRLEEQQAQAQPN